MRYRTRETLKEVLGFAALILTFSAVLLYIPIWFSYLDCNTAKHQLQFIDTCIADENCTLSQAEHLRYKAYLRMEIYACPVKPNPPTDLIAS